jgi:phosphoribosylcarboxyaminoimidazole (NCAIR) mutase
MVIGSKSCWKYMGEAVELLKRFGVEVEVSFCLLITEPPEP